MRTYVGERKEDGTTEVQVVDAASRPELGEIGALLSELRDLTEAHRQSSMPDHQVVERELAFMARKHDLLSRIEVFDPPAEPVVPLTGSGPSADGGFVWGEQTLEAFHLASAILADAVGDTPPEAVAARFLQEVVAQLPRDRFELGVDEVNDWLLENRLFVEAELAASRGNMLPHGPALAVTTEDSAGAGGEGPAFPEPLADPATASALVAACEQAWAEIRRHHPDVPHAVVVLGSGVERGRLVKLGHWWGGRWLADGEVRGEVLLAGEALHLPAEHVFEVLLHEAAHGLNAARGVQDASRGGRYHNGRFKATAETVGLEVTLMAPHGWARTALTPETAERYGDTITKLGEAMRIARTIDRGIGTGVEDGREYEGRTGSRDAKDDHEQPGVRPAICGCGRRLRMAPSVLAAGPVLCGLCGDEFEVGRRATRSPDRDTAAPAAARAVVDHTFLARRQDAIAREGLEPETPHRPGVHQAHRLAAFVTAARDGGLGAHPAVVALAHRQAVLGDGDSPAVPRPDDGQAIPNLTPTQREGLVELAVAGDKPGDAAVVIWYQAFGGEQEHAMASGSPAEADRRRQLARAMLKADGTLHGPAIEAGGRELMAGDRVVVGAPAIPCDDLAPGVPGIIQRIDPAGHWVEVDFPTAGHYRFPAVGPAVSALEYAYAEINRGVDRIDLRTLDLRRPAEAERVPSAHVPEVEF
jgi:hypothetical protein